MDGAGPKFWSDGGVMKMSYLSVALLAPEQHAYGSLMQLVISSHKIPYAFIYTIGLLQK